MMAEQPLSVDDVITFLNEALALDSDAITALVNQRVQCNRELGDHPTIQVGYWPKDGSIPEAGSENADDGNSELKVGVLGLLNGLFGFNEDGWGYITARYDEYPGPIVRFERTPLRGRREHQ